MAKINLKNYCTIYLVRHAETDWNVKKVLQGHTDSPLTDLGKEQAKLLAKKFRDLHFDAVFSSDLLRAKKTAELITLEKKLAVQTTKALRERYFGVFEGKRWQGIEFKIRKILKKMSDLSLKRWLKLKLFEDEESDAELMTRFITFLREIAVGYQRKNILVVSHGGVIRQFLIHLGQIAKHDFVQIRNLSYLKLESDGVDFFVKEMEGISYL